MKRLRIPSVLAVTIAAGSAVAGIALACGGGQSPPGDANPPISDGQCSQFCIPDGTDAGVCPEPLQCVDSMGNCPAGCEPEPIA